MNISALRSFWLWWDLQLVCHCRMCWGALAEGGALKYGCSINFKAGPMFVVILGSRFELAQVSAQLLCQSFVLRSCSWPGCNDASLFCRFLPAHAWIQQRATMSTAPAPDQGSSWFIKQIARGGHTFQCAAGPRSSICASSWHSTTLSAGVRNFHPKPQRSPR